MEHFFETVTPYDQKALRDFAKIHYRRTHLVMLALLPLLGGLLLLVGVGSLLLPFSELGAGAWLLVAAGGTLLLLEGRFLTGRVAVRASTPRPCRSTACASIPTGWNTPAARPRGFITTISLSGPWRGRNIFTFTPPGSRPCWWGRRG